MSELHLQPVPSQLDYKAGFELADDTFTHYGGVRSHLMEVEYDAQYGRSQVRYDNVYWTGKLALRLEPKDERGIAIDKTLRITHAFKRGMLAAFYATHLVYDGRIDASDIRQFIDVGVVHEEIESDGALITDPPLLEWGRHGLDFIGEETAGITDRWAEKFYDDEETKRLFRLGAGAVAATAHQLAMNETLSIIDEILTTNDWDEELQNLTRPNTGE